MKEPVITLLLAFFIGLPLGHANEPVAERTLDVEEIEGFLTNITGAWRGNAVLTPVGPLPYDITFTRMGDNGVEGAADPGAAIHYWRFVKQEDGVKLRFLSTFRGNTEPIYLLARSRLGKAVVFRALDPSYLEVHVSLAARDSFIRVLLRDELHVEILLENDALLAPIR